MEMYIIIILIALLLLIIIKKETILKSNDHLDQSTILSKKIQASTEYFEFVHLLLNINIDNLILYKKLANIKTSTPEEITEEALSNVLNGLKIQITPIEVEYTFSELEYEGYIDSIKDNYLVYEKEEPIYDTLTKNTLYKLILIPKNKFNVEEKCLYTSEILIKMLTMDGMAYTIDQLNS